MLCTLFSVIRHYNQSKMMPKDLEATWPGTALTLVIHSIQSPHKMWQQFGRYMESPSKWLSKHKAHSPPSGNMICGKKQRVEQHSVQPDALIDMQWKNDIKRLESHCDLTTYKNWTIYFVSTVRFFLQISGLRVRSTNWTTRVQILSYMHFLFE